MNNDKEMMADLLNRLEENKQKLFSFVSEDKKEDFEAVFDEIMGLKWKIDFKPAMVQVNEGDVIRKVDSDTFYIAETYDCAVLHTYGGYTLIADNRNGSSLFTMMRELAEYIENPEKYFEASRKEIVDAENLLRETPMTKEEEDAFVEKMKDSVKTDFTVREFLMKLPWWCFCDVNATYKIAKTAYDALAELMENASSEISREDKEANAAFEAAIDGAESIAREIRKDNIS